MLALALSSACSDKKHKAHEDAATKSVDAAVAKLVDAAIVDAAVKAGRSEHAVWKLVDNRHMAHRGVDGGDLVIDATTAAFARYTRFGVPVMHWHLGASVGGERGALADNAAAIDVPIIPEQPQPTQLTVRVNSAEGKQQLQVTINGKKSRKDARAKRALEAGWQTVAFPLEKSWIKAGENTIVFETSGKSQKKVAFSWLRVGAVKPPGDQNPLGAATFDVKGDAIELADRASVTWYVTMPEGAHLVADVAKPCKVEVGARAGDASFVGGLLGGDQNRVDLSGIAGKVVRLSLTTRDCARARIVQPRITLHGPDPEKLPKSEPPKYIVLWIMDALRADKIPIFTPGARAQTPNIDELAKTSAIFRQYYVQGNESQTSHSTMWTSLYPAVHNVRLAGRGGAWKIDRRFDIIGDKLTSAGYFTTAITGNGFVDSAGGYARGFREFRNMMREKGVVNGILPGEQIVSAALAKLEKYRQKPVFLFLGTIDNHSPWVARKPWIDQYSPGPYTGPFQEMSNGRDLGFLPDSMGCHKIPPKEDIERLRAIYDSAVSYDDQQVGRVIKQLKSWGIWDQTMLIITADHGEEFFEHMRCGHGGALVDSLIRVPLLIHDPARFPGGTIVEEGAEAIDLLPTILDSIGQPLFNAAQGAQLQTLAQGVGRGWSRPSYSSMYEYAHAMRIARWKLRVGNTGVPILSDMTEDPGEMKDFLAVRPVERRMMTDHLSMFLALRKLWKKSAWGVTTNVTAAGAAALDEVATP